MNLKRLSDTAIMAGLIKGLGMSAEGLREAAPYYVEARERGLDLSGITNPTLSYLPYVASGKLDPEILVRFGGFAPVLALAATLVPEDQQRILANDGKVQVVDTTGKVREARLAGLSRAVLRQVIGGGRVRTPDEQKQHMTPTPPPRPTKPAICIAEWNVLNALDPSQKSDLQKRADKAGITPAEYLVQFAVSRRGLKDKVVTVTSDALRKLQAALSRARALDRSRGAEMV